MRKRLRKKLHRDEFREYGFEVRYILIKGTDWGPFWDEFAEFIEGLGLLMGGSIGTETHTSNLFVCKAAKGVVVTRAQADQVRDWLAKHPQVKTSMCMELEDAWASRKRRKRHSHQDVVGTAASVTEEDTSGPRPAS